jgi:hypothetical protein
MRQTCHHLIQKVSFVILFLTGISAPAQQINEILGRPTGVSVTINLIASEAVEVYAEYGKESGSYGLTTAVMSTDEYLTAEFDLTGLSPDTRYFYRTRFRRPGAPSFSSGQEHSFVTCRAKGSTFCFTIESDVHPYDKKGCHPLWEVALDNQLSDRPDFMLDLGDTFGDDHTVSTITSQEVRELQLQCRDFFGAVCHSMPLFFCLGNHEGENGYYLSQDPPANLAVYETQWRKEYYPNPFPNGFYSGNTTEEPYGIGYPENYYAWEWGDALFVVIDVYRYYTISAKPGKWDWTIGKTQYDWLKTTLENSDASHKFVFAHHLLGQGRGGEKLANLYEWGGYSEKGDWEFGENRPGWAVPIHQLMVNNGVDIFFQGHDHLFAREEVDGVTYQEIPMPSDSSYQLGVLANADAYGGTVLDGSGYLRVTVMPDSVKVEYVLSVLPQHETASRKNGTVAFSYVLPAKSSGIRDEEQEGDFKLFPNPAGDELNIEIPGPVQGEVSVMISSMEGRVYHSKKFIPDTPYYRLNLKGSGNLPPGFYVVSVSKADAWAVSRKLVVY